MRTRPENSSLLDRSSLMGLSSGDPLAQPAPQFKAAPNPFEVIKKKNKSSEEKVVLEAMSTVKEHENDKRTAFTGHSKSNPTGKSGNHNAPYRTGGGVLPSSPYSIRLKRARDNALVDYGQLSEESAKKIKVDNVGEGRNKLKKFSKDSKLLLQNHIRNANGTIDNADQVIVSACAEGQYHKSKSDHLANALLNKIWAIDGKITPKSPNEIRKNYDENFILDGSRQTYNLTVAITRSKENKGDGKETVWIAANVLDKINGKVVGATILEENKKEERKKFFEKVVAETVLDSKVLSNKKKFNIVYLPAKAEEISLHSELRVFRELIGRGVIGKGKNVKERLVDFGGSKANCLLCAHQILDGLQYIDFFKGTTKKAPLPNGFRLDGDAKKSVNFHYHTQTVTPQSQTMVPGNFYSHFRREKITKIINEALEKSLENSTPSNQDLIKNYFNGLIEEPRLFAVDNFKVPTFVNNELNDLATGVQGMNLKGNTRKVLKDEPKVNTKEIENKLRAFKNSFPANGNLSVENHKELQKAFIDALGKGKEGDYKFQAQKDEKFSIDRQQDNLSSYTPTARQTIVNESSDYIPRSQMNKSADNNRAVAKDSKVISNYFLRSQKQRATK